MIKVKQNTFRPGFKIKQINGLYHNSLRLHGLNHDEKDFLNFATDDFLGINRKFRLAVHHHSPHNTLITREYVINSLHKIFNCNIAFIPDETLVHEEILKRVIKQNDLIIVDELVNPILKLAVKQPHGNKILILRNNSLEKLEELVNAQNRTGTNIWYVAQSIYPVPGTVLPAKKLYSLLRKYNHLFCYVDDSYGLSWSGTGGKGLVLENIEYPERLLVTASLTKGFGANTGAVAMSNIPELSSILNGNIVGHNMQSLMFAADLHNTNDLILLQSQLQENIHYYQKLTEGNLPSIGDPELPVSFIAGGLPEICHEISAEMLKQGFYVSPAIFPHASIKQPGIKINMSADFTKPQIKNMTEALKRTYHIALKKRNKTLTDILENNN